MGVGGGLDSRSTPSSRGSRGMGFRCCTRPEEVNFFERIGRNHQASQEDPHPRGVKRGGEWDIGENTGDVNHFITPPLQEREDSLAENGYWMSHDTMGGPSTQRDRVTGGRWDPGSDLLP